MFNLMSFALFWAIHYAADTPSLFLRPAGAHLAGSSRKILIIFEVFNFFEEILLRVQLCPLYTAQKSL